MAAPWGQPKSSWCMGQHVKCCPHLPGDAPPSTLANPGNGKRSSGDEWMDGGEHLSVICCLRHHLSWLHRWASTASSAVVREALETLQFLPIPALPIFSPQKERQMGHRKEGERGMSPLNLVLFSLLLG